MLRRLSTLCPRVKTCRIEYENQTSRMKFVTSNIKYQTYATLGGAFIYPFIQIITEAPIGWYSIICCGTHTIAAYQGYKSMNELLMMGHSNIVCKQFKFYSLNRNLDIILSNEKLNWYSRQLVSPEKIKHYFSAPSIDILCSSLRDKMNNLYYLRQQRFRANICASLFGYLGGDFYTSMMNSINSDVMYHGIIIATTLFLVNSTSRRGSLIKEIRKSIDEELKKKWILLPTRQLISW